MFPQCQIHAAKFLARASLASRTPNNGAPSPCTSELGILVSRACLPLDVGVRQTLFNSLHSCHVSGSNEEVVAGLELTVNLGGGGREGRDHGPWDVLRAGVPGSHSSQLYVSSPHPYPIIPRPFPLFSLACFSPCWYMNSRRSGSLSVLLITEP